MGAWHCAAASSVYYTLADAASCAQKPLLEGRDIALTFASLCCPAVGWPRAHQLQRKIMFQGLCGMIRSSERGQQAHLELRSVQQAPVGGPDVDKHAKVCHLGLRSHTEGSPGERLEPYTHMPQACAVNRLAGERPCSWGWLRARRFQQMRMNRQLRVLLAPQIAGPLQRPCISSKLSTHAGLLVYKGSKLRQESIERTA